MILTDRQADRQTAEMASPNYISIYLYIFICILLFRLVLAVLESRLLLI